MEVIECQSCGMEMWSTDEHCGNCGDYNYDYVDPEDVPLVDPALNLYAPLTWHEKLRMSTLLNGLVSVESAKVSFSKTMTRDPDELLKVAARDGFLTFGVLGPAWQGDIGPSPDEQRAQAEKEKEDGGE